MVKFRAIVIFAVVLISSTLTFAVTFEERVEAQIEILEHLKSALCIRELTNPGRQHVNRLLTNKRNELSNLKKQAGHSKNRDGRGAGGV